MAVVVARQPVLPAGRPGNQKFRVAQEIVRACPLVRIGRQQSLTVKVPLSRNSGTAVGMPRPQAEQHAAADLHAEVSALQCIRVVGVRTLAVGVELVGKNIVVKTRTRARERCISVRRAKRPAIGS